MCVVRLMTYVGVCVVRLMTYVGLVLGVVAVTLNVYGIEKVIDAFHFFGSV